ncbi:serine, glycine and glutamine-rich protein-like [Cylas formicarius]|uniref:serine, glycine and glutamine-rich protein-like n=1 Tax=Cylas formicarius TaxID=197179 RepID=UPI002958A65B|nr:serine, glycine and glutamine-rich protein-like [Cylas formicarius]
MRLPVSLVLLVLGGTLSAEPAVKGDRGEFKRSFSKNCDTSYTVTCFKLDIVSWVDKLNENDDYAVLPGVSIVRENSTDGSNTADIVADLARDFPNDPDARLDVFLMKKVTGFMNSHSIKLKLWNNNEGIGARKGGGGGGFGGGGGKGGGGGGMGAVLAMGAMMKGALMSMALAGLAAIAGKALMLAMMSLVLSLLAGLKGGGGGGKTTYEVVAKPVYSQSHSHSVSHEDYGGHYGHSGHGRSFAEEPLPLGLLPDYKPGQ